MPAKGQDGRALRLTAIICGVAGLAIACPAEAAPRVPTGFFGVAVEGPMLRPATDVKAEFGRMTAAGVESIVTEFNWAAEQPTEGAPPDFARTDRIVLEAAARRMTVLPVVVYAPDWGAADPGNPASPPRPVPFAAYLTAAIGRYGPRGSLWAEHPEVAKLAVRDWQVWNEPSHEGFWSLQPFAARYVRVLRAAHGAIKRADPGARTVLAGLVYDSWRQLELLYNAGARGSFDAVSLHPYTRKLDNVMLVLRRDRHALDRHSDRSVPLLITELSWPSSVGKTDSRYGYEVTEQGQADQLRKALPRLASARRKLRIERVFWFSWLSAETDPTYPFDYAGLRKLTPDGGTRDKPALGAYRRSTLALEGCRRKDATAKRCG